MKEKILKCSYSKCLHSSCELSQEEAVKVNNRYMHRDCAEYSRKIKMIIDTYYNTVSNTAVMSQLGAVVNNLVFKKKFDPDYVLFVINHAVEAKIPIKSPLSLHYLVNNLRIKELWEKKKGDEIANQIKEQAAKLVEPPQQEKSFKFNVDKNAGFGEILRGGK